MNFFRCPTKEPISRRYLAKMTLKAVVLIIVCFLLARTEGNCTMPGKAAFLLMMVGTDNFSSEDTTKRPSRPRLLVRPNIFIVIGSQKDIDKSYYAAGGPNGQYWYVIVSTSIELAVKKLSYYLAGEKVQNIVLSCHGGEMDRTGFHLSGVLDIDQDNKHAVSALTIDYYLNDGSLCDSLDKEDVRALQTLMGFLRDNNKAKLCLTACFGGFQAEGIALGKELLVLAGDRNILILLNQDRSELVYDGNGHIIIEGRYGSGYGMTKPTEYKNGWLLFSKDQPIDSIRVLKAGDSNKAALQWGPPPNR